MAPHHPPQPPARGPRGARGPAGCTCSVCSAPASPAPTRLLLQSLPPPPRPVAAPSSLPAANFLREEKGVDGRRRGPGARSAPPREGGVRLERACRGGRRTEAACARPGAPGKAEIVPPSPAPHHIHAGEVPLPWEPGTPVSPSLSQYFQRLEPHTCRQSRRPGSWGPQGGELSLPLFSWDSRQTRSIRDPPFSLPGHPPAFDPGGISCPYQDSHANFHLSSLPILA